MYRQRRDQPYTIPFNTPRQGQDAAKAAVEKVLWNGFPWDMAGLKERYQLEEWEFEFITGAAVHYWSDSWYGQTTGIGVLCFILKELSGEYIDAQGVLHKKFFYIPIGFIEDIFVRNTYGFLIALVHI